MIGQKKMDDRLRKLEENNTIRYCTDNINIGEDVHIEGNNESGKQFKDVEEDVHVDVRHEEEFEDVFDNISLAQRFAIVPFAPKKNRRHC